MKPIFHETFHHRLVIMLLALILASNVTGQDDSISDIQGNTYKIIQIGDQWWMAENLRTTQYANGDEIPHITDNSDWENTKTGAFCSYNNSANSIDTFGNLYNWYTVNDERGICPLGWQVASDRDWIIMEKYLGMSASEAGRMTAWRGTDEGAKLKHESFGGNNSSGFTALGTGYRDPQGVYKAKGTDNDYWTSTAYSNNGDTEGVLHGFLNSKSTVVRNFHVPGYGFCVRCVKNNSTEISMQPAAEPTRVFPNPTHTRLYISDAIGEALTITNIAGQQILNDVITLSMHQVDVSDWNPGTYILTVSGHASAYSQKFIKR